MRTFLAATTILLTVTGFAHAECYQIQDMDAYRTCQQKLEAEQRAQIELQGERNRINAERDRAYTQRRQDAARQRVTTTRDAADQRFGRTPDVFASFANAQAYIDRQPATNEGVAALRDFMANNNYQRVKPDDLGDSEIFVEQNNLYDRASRRIIQIEPTLVHANIERKMPPLAFEGDHPETAFLSRTLLIQTVAYGQAVSTNLALSDVLHFLRLGSWRQTDSGWRYNIDNNDPGQPMHVSMLFAPVGDNQVTITNALLNRQPLAATETYMLLRDTFMQAQMVGRD